MCSSVSCSNRVCLTYGEWSCGETLCAGSLLGAPHSSGLQVTQVPFKMAWDTEGYKHLGSNIQFSINDVCSDVLSGTDLIHLCRDGNELTINPVCTLARATCRHSVTSLCAAGLRGTHICRPVERRV